MDTPVHMRSRLAGEARWIWRLAVGRQGVPVYMYTLHSTGIAKALWGLGRLFGPGLELDIQRPNTCISTSNVRPRMDCLGVLRLLHLLAFMARQEVSLSFLLRC